MAFAASTAINTGKACTIWPVSSKASSAVEMVWVTAPEKAAAPTGRRAPAGGSGQRPAEGRATGAMAKCLAEIAQKPHLEEAPWLGWVRGSVGRQGQDGCYRA